MFCFERIVLYHIHNLERISVNFSPIYLLGKNRVTFSERSENITQKLVFCQPKYNLQGTLPERFLLAGKPLPEPMLT